MENLSEKVKSFLTNKRETILIKIKKLKRKRKIIKILYYSSVVLSISLSTIIASLTGFGGIPMVVLTSLSISSGILTAISTKFNFYDKTLQLNQLIDKLNKLEHAINYVISCNGDFTENEYQKILKEFV